MTPGGVLFNLVKHERTMHAPKEGELGMHAPIGGRTCNARSHQLRAYNARSPVVTHALAMVLVSATLLGEYPGVLDVLENSKNASLVAS